MSAPIYITASVVISQGEIYKNGIPVFVNKDAVAVDFLLAAYQQLALKYPKFYKMDNLSKLGWLAADILLKSSFEEVKYKPEDVGIVFMNASSSLDADLKYFESTKAFASPALFVYTLPNIVMGEICIKHKLKGENAFFIFEAFDADFMEKYVDGLINNNTLQACICGWVEWIGEEYKAVLFLVEKDISYEEHLLDFDNPGEMMFTKENLNKIYQSHNG